MRTGISLTVTADDRHRLEAIVADRNTPQKHVWRARIVLLTAAGAGTTTIMREAGVSKTVVWRWQERFMHEGASRATRRTSESCSNLGPEVDPRAAIGDKSLPRP